MQNTVNEITVINETAGPSWVTPGYDSAGNMTTIPRPAEPTGDFTGIYDAWNRLVELRDLDDTVVGRYEYDGLTRRVVKHTFPGWEELEAADWDAMTAEDWNGLQLTQAHRRDYYYNTSWQILEERVENDTVFDRQYVWGLRYIDGLVFRDRQLTSSVQRNYALQDANWNVTAITDDNGAVVERYSYTAYGVPTFLNPDFTEKAGSDYGWNVLYAGYKWDSESALYQVRFRYLQPSLGGWGSRDPIGYRVFASSHNLYLYAKLNPLGYLDFYGLIDEAIAGPEVRNNPSVDQWMDNNLFSVISKNLNPNTKTMVRAGCMGLTMVNVEWNDYEARGIKSPFPNLDNCYPTVERAHAAKNKLKCDPCKENETTLYKNIPKARIFWIQYSSNNIAFKGKPANIGKAPLAKAEGGPYDLSGHFDTIVLASPNAETGIPFDVALLSESGDPWYDPGKPWLHADTSGDGMSIFLADWEGMIRQFDKNKSDFDTQFWCVACAKCSNK